MFKKKSKLVLKEDKFVDEGLMFSSSEHGNSAICTTMALAYIASMIVEGVTNKKEVDKLLKGMIEEAKEREEDAKWL